MRGEVLKKRRYDFKKGLELSSSRFCCYYDKMMRSRLRGFEAMLMIWDETESENSWFYFLFICWRFEQDLIHVSAQWDLKRNFLSFLANWWRSQSMIENWKSSPHCAINIRIFQLSLSHHMRVSMKFFLFINKLIKSRQLIDYMTLIVVEAEKRIRTELRECTGTRQRWRQNPTLLHRVCVEKKVWLP